MDIFFNLCRLNSYRQTTIVKMSRFHIKCAGAAIYSGDPPHPPHPPHGWRINSGGQVFGLTGIVGFWVKNRGCDVSLRYLGEIGKRNLVKAREKCVKMGKKRAKKRILRKNIGLGVHLWRRIDKFFRNYTISY